jgi:AcrR family transcriptional regulator
MISLYRRKAVILMRISKEPEVRKREIINTAMRVFTLKGYEETSMADIAKEMNVVPGLCYRYFPSKKELYETALSVYSQELTDPMKEILGDEGLELDKAIERMSEKFLMTDGNEKYHSFFHKSGNEMFHRQLEIKMIHEVLPYLIRLLEHLKGKGTIQTEDVETAATFILYGQLPILNDDSLTPEQKLEKIIPVMKKILD